MTLAVCIRMVQTSRALACLWQEAGMNCNFATACGSGRNRKVWNSSYVSYHAHIIWINTNELITPLYWAPSAIKYWKSNYQSIYFAPGEYSLRKCLLIASLTWEFGETINVDIKFSVVMRWTIEKSGLVRDIALNLVFLFWIIPEKCFQKKISFNGRYLLFIWVFII